MQSALWSSLWLPTPWDPSRDEFLRLYFLGRRNFRHQKFRCLWFYHPVNILEWIFVIGSLVISYIRFRVTFFILILMIPVSELLGVIWNLHEGLFHGYPWISRVLLGWYFFTCTPASSKLIMRHLVLSIIFLIPYTHMSGKILLVVNHSGMFPTIIRPVYPWPDIDGAFYIPSRLSSTFSAPSVASTSNTITLNMAAETASGTTFAASYSTAISMTFTTTTAAMSAIIVMENSTVSLLLLIG